MRRSPVQLHKAWRAVWGVGRWVAKCKRSAGGKALTSAQEEVLRKAAEGLNSDPGYNGDGPFTFTPESLHAYIEREQAEGAGANSIDVPSLEQTAAWLALYPRQKVEEAARRDDTEPGYMIVLKAVGASDGEDDGEWAGRMRAMKNLIQKGREEHSTENAERSKQIAELEQKMGQQNKELKQQNAALEQKMGKMDEKLAAILAAVQRTGRQ
jgi:hypothetical protein